MAKDHLRTNNYPGYSFFMCANTLMRKECFRYFHSGVLGGNPSGSFGNPPGEQDVILLPGPKIG
ncbi:hypothetical protein D3C87_1957900 [compost metagenome]